MRTEKTNIRKINQRTKKRNNNNKKKTAFSVAMCMLPNKTNVLPMANNTKPVMKETTLSACPNSEMHADKESADTRRVKRKRKSNIMCPILPTQ